MKKVGFILSGIVILLGVLWILPKEKENILVLDKKETPIQAFLFA